MTRAFRWFPHDGRRHAIADDLLPGDDGKTLCDAEVSVPRQRSSKTEWLWPTCVCCDVAWRQSEGIALWVSQ